ncbi:hypothetical protein D3C81_1532190 [compost metagenome]
MAGLNVALRVTDRRVFRNERVNFAEDAVSVIFRDIVNRLDADLIRCAGFERNNRTFLRAAFVVTCRCCFRANLREHRHSITFLYDYCADSLRHDRAYCARSAARTLVQTVRLERKPLFNRSVTLRQ